MATVRLVIGGLLAALAAMAVPPPSAADSHHVWERLDRLKRERRRLLEDLVAPVEACVRRQDTEHAAFHGCIDWHSAVHGTWALVKYTQLSGDARYVPLLRGLLAREKVDAERALLRQRPTFEMPYGRAWFLRLARDHREAFASDLLAPMGDAVAESLLEFYRRSPPDPMRREYGNASWALINLHAYGMSRRDARLAAFVEETVRRHFLPVRQPCPVQHEESLWPDFLPVCTTWAYLVAQVAPGEDLEAWLQGFLPRGVPIAPIRRPRTDHHMGMNFSRAWGFWRLFAATRNPRYLELYLDHVETQVANPAWWKGDYRAVGHWVAQFGVFALAPIFAEEAGARRGDGGAVSSPASPSPAGPR